MQLLEELLRLGMRDVVLSPGSRSQALALAAAECERLGMLRLHVRIDERVAGFLALGLSVESGRPVAVITTSGTAVANLHPAVLEARHSGVPLILLTADRPEELRGIGSNQTTEQRAIFGAAVIHEVDVAAPTGAGDDGAHAGVIARTAWEAATGASGGRLGPAHLNLAFSDPLSAPISFGETAGLAEPTASPEPVEGRDDLYDRPSDRGNFTILRPQPGTVVVAGAGAGERAEAVARSLGAPLLAEVSSGSRFGPNLVTAYRELISTANFGDRVERVVVFGHPTLSREVPALIQRDGVTTIVVRSPGADDYNPGRRVSQFADAVRVEGEPDDSARSWIGRWVAASRALREPAAEAPATELGSAEFARRELEAIREPITRRMLVEAVWRATWPHDRLVLGASRLIREADRFVQGKRIPVHANRGLAGIDGTISTAVGIALASEYDGGTTRVLLGDLAALHDAGGLLFGRDEAQPRIQVIVGNDGGGTLFDSLEVAATAPAAALDRVLLTPQAVEFEQLAAAYGWGYLRAGNRGELDQALTASARPTLIEVSLPR